MSSLKLTLSLQFARGWADDWMPEDGGPALHRAALPRHAVARWLRHALARDAEITARIVGAAEGRQLNRDYRHKDYATNVLTFDYAQQPIVLADLVLCAPVVAREAREQRKPLRAHYAHLLVHGALHAQGWDHETSAAAARAMEARETQILQALGFDDPYTDKRHRIRS
jgi:probable rRNA maturation factor